MIKIHSSNLESQHQAHTGAHSPIPILGWGLRTIPDYPTPILVGQEGAE